MELEAPLPGRADDGLDLSPASPAQYHEEAEKQLLYLHQEEGSHRRIRGPPLSQQLVELFYAMPAEAVPRCRAALDAGLVFRPDGSAADLRSLVFESELPPQQQQLILDRIRACCPTPEADQPGFVVLSDIDDTLLPGADALKIAGADRSWHLDGRLYPGVSRLHQELRGGLREQYGGDYTVLLTARPPSFVRSLGEKCRRLTRKQNPRLAILPGEGGTAIAMNALRVLTGNYSRLGDTKVQRMREYALLFPDFAGRFVFIGDDGQADLVAAERMLQLRPSMLGSPVPPGGSKLGAIEAPLLAFVAIKSCYTSNKERLGSIKSFFKEAVAPEERHETVRRVRATHPAVRREGGQEGAARHRFFYFDDYLDLAEELTRAGWLRPEQRDAVQRAWKRDSVPDPLELGRECDLLGLQAALKALKDLSMTEADDQELDSFIQAQILESSVKKAHVFLGAPPAEAVALRLKVRSLTLGNVEWPPAAGARPPVAEPLKGSLVHKLADWDVAGTTSGMNLYPRFTLWDAASEKARRWEDPTGDGFQIEWPCEALSRRGARYVLDVALAQHVGRCFLLLQDDPSEPDDSPDRPDGDHAREVAGSPADKLLTAQWVHFDSHGPDPSKKTGIVSLLVSWGVPDVR